MNFRFTLKYMKKVILGFLLFLSFLSKGQSSFSIDHPYWRMNAMDKRLLSQSDTLNLRKVDSLQQVVTGFVFNSDSTFWQKDLRCGSSSEPMKGNWIISNDTVYLNPTNHHAPLKLLFIQQTDAYLQFLVFYKND